MSLKYPTSTKSEEEKYGDILVRRRKLRQLVSEEESKAPAKMR